MTYEFAKKIVHRFCHSWFVRALRTSWFVRALRTSWFVRALRTSWFVRALRTSWFVRALRTSWFVRALRTSWFVRALRIRKSKTHFKFQRSSIKLPIYVIHMQYNSVTVKLSVPCITV